jgi:putative transposase
MRPMTEALSHVQMALVVRANPDLRELNLSLAGFSGLGQEGSVKRARFSEEQIIAILRETEAGAKLTDLCRRHGISEGTFYAWRGKYGGLEVSEMRRLRQLEEENRRLKAIVADQERDIRALKDVLAKDGYVPR